MWWLGARALDSKSVGISACPSEKWVSKEYLTSEGGCGDQVKSYMGYVMEQLCGNAHQMSAWSVVQDVRNSSVQTFCEYTPCLLYPKSPREGRREWKRKEKEIKKY